MGKNEKNKDDFANNEELKIRAARTKDLIAEKRKTRNRDRISLNDFNVGIKQYFKSRLFRDYAFILSAAFLSMISYDYFIAPTTSNGITPTGIGAIARGISIAIWPNQSELSLQTTMYWVFFLTMNVPLFIFGVLKVGWRFSIRTIIYVLFQNGFHFAFAFIPVINPTEFNLIVNYNDINTFHNSQGMYQIWLFVFATVAGVLNGISFGIVYKGGSSTAGIDFVLAYYSTKYKKSIANYNRVVNYFIILIVLAIHTILMSSTEITRVYFGNDWQDKIDEIGKIVGSNNIDRVNGLTNSAFAIYKVKYFFGPALFGSYLFVITQSVVTDIIFPKFKYRSLMVITSRGDDVVTGLQFVKYPNDIVRIASKDHYDGKTINNEIIIVSTSLLDYKWVKAAIVVADPDAKILSHKLDRVIADYSVSNY
ncbi:YitT family protein [Spiroplasma chrysopicola]|uniref:YitT family protein n=1 Tax=Spiroplasma chrysopicola DF-1 TaxID=1276227 RepID=R4UAR9_9MOLU|nr:YitT family protein [Spiroplasma chrysopicola]AGM25004.1 hypothetical protein SCHRY_v1c04220 [Spiroplasma chrysopicola DF-1]